MPSRTTRPNEESSSATSRGWAGSAIGRPTRNGPSRHSHEQSRSRHDEPEKVQGIVLLRKNEETLPALKDVKAKIEELNDPARAGCCPA